MNWISTPKRWMQTWKNLEFFLQFSFFWNGLSTNRSLPVLSWPCYTLQLIGHTTLHCSVHFLIDCSYYSAFFIYPSLASSFTVSTTTWFFLSVVCYETYVSVNVHLSGWFEQGCWPACDGINLIYRNYELKLESINNP